jgi:hypothetical protein
MDFSLEVPTMSSQSTATPTDPDYRKYRRFIAVLTLSLIGTSVIWVLVSVGLTISHRASLTPPGDGTRPAGGSVDLSACRDELAAHASALERHLENFHHLLGSYHPDDAQKWAEEGLLWRLAWSDMAARCQFSALGASGSKAHERMATAHASLGDIQARVTAELKRFGTDHATRLQQIRSQLETIDISPAP